MFELYVGIAAIFFILGIIELAEKNIFSLKNLLWISIASFVWPVAVGMFFVEAVRNIKR